MCVFLERANFPTHSLPLPFLKQPNPPPPTPQPAPPKAKEVAPATKTLKSNNIRPPVKKDSEIEEFKSILTVGIEVMKHGESTFFVKRKCRKLKYGESCFPHEKKRKKHKRDCTTHTLRELTIICFLVHICIRTIR